MRVGDYDGAVLAYERELVAAPESAVILEKLAGAKRSAAQHHAGQALRAMNRGDTVTASSHLNRAERLAPDAPVVLRTRRRIGDRLTNVLEAQQLKDDARSVRVADPEQAEELLTRARTLNPADDEIIRMLRDATVAAEGERSADRAVAAWEAGDRVKATGELAASRAGGRHPAGARALTRRIARELLREADSGDADVARQAWATGVRAGVDAAAIRDLRDLLGQKLTARAATLASTGWTATAALLELEATRAGADVATPALDQAVARAAVRLIVFPFDDGPDGAVDGVALARRLVDQVVSDGRAGGQALVVYGPDEDPAAAVDAFPRAVQVRGEVREATVKRNPVGRALEAVTYRSGVETEPNPEAVAVLDEIEAIQIRLVEQEDRLAGAETALEKLDQIVWFDSRAQQRARQGNLAHQARVARAQARVDEARRDVDSVRAQDTAARERLRGMPSEIEIPVYSEHTRSVTTTSISSSLRVRLLIEGASAANEPGNEIVLTGTDRHRETVAPGDGAKGIPEDRDDSPNDAEMATRAADRLVSLASARLRSLAETAASRFLVDGRRAERAGRDREACEAYALYLLSTPEVASPQRADAARAVSTLAGIRVPLRTGFAGTRP